MKPLRRCREKAPCDLADGLVVDAGIPQFVEVEPTKFG
jgi:hypothetical protein